MSTNIKALDRSSAGHFKIKVTKNGPYIVFGGVPLKVNTVVLDTKGVPYRWKPGERYPVERTYSLCRCGQSKTQPFCDGSHQRIQFDGAETASRVPYRDQAEIFKGPELTLTDLPGLCIHAGFCDRMGGTWALTQYSDTPEARKIAIEQAANCPSGRLVVWDKKGNPIEAEYEPSIELVEDPNTGMNGPFWVRGGIPIESADGKTYEVRNRVTLCRCGKSKNKPFCDGLHLEK